MLSHNHGVCIWQGAQGCFIKNQEQYRFEIMLVVFLDIEILAGQYMTSSTKLVVYSIIAGTEPFTPS